MNMRDAPIGDRGENGQDAQLGRNLPRTTSTYFRSLAIAVPAKNSRGGGKLSRRERECLALAANGKTDRQIGKILSLSEKTVSTYIQRAKLRYGVKTRIQAVVFALRDGEIAV